MGTIGERIVIFDHECAFSFLLAIFPNARPWELSGKGYLSNHVLRDTLKGLQYDDSFADRLGSLEQRVISSFSDEIPEKWERECLPQIELHLRLMRDNVRAFVDELQGTLR